MTLADIERVKADFVSAAKCALAAGFEWLELHFAHGYLAQSFFSVHANQPTDSYGADWRGRGHFLLETLMKSARCGPSIYAGRQVAAGAGTRWQVGFPETCSRLCFPQMAYRSGEMRRSAIRCGRLQEAVVIT